MSQVKILHVVQNLKLNELIFFIHGESEQAPETIALNKMEITLKKCYVCHNYVQETVQNNNEKHSSYSLSNTYPTIC